MEHPMIPTPPFSHAVLDVLDAVGADWRDDRDALRRGTHTPSTLLDHCLAGVEDDAVAAIWRDYVATLTAHSDRDFAIECDEWKTLAIFLRGSLSGLLIDLTGGFNRPGPKAHKRAIEEALGDDLYAGEQIKKLTAKRNALAQVSR